MMNMTCNIDQRGRKVRFVSDILFDGCGAALLVWGVLTAGVGLIMAGVALSVVGGFMIFEAARGWCALRAMDIKTPW